MNKYDQAYKLLSDYLEEATDNSGLIKSLQTQKDQLILQRNRLSEQVQKLNDQIADISKKISAAGGPPDTTNNKP
jgi:chaperonin cofactor prefoldin